MRIKECMIAKLLITIIQEIKENSLESIMPLNYAIDMQRKPIMPKGVGNF